VHEKRERMQRQRVYGVRQRVRQRVAARATPRHFIFMFITPSDVDDYSFRHYVLPRFFDTLMLLMPLFYAAAAARPSSARSPDFQRRFRCRAPAAMPRCAAAVPRDDAFLRDAAYTATPRRCLICKK